LKTALWVDWNNNDGPGRIRLNCRGTVAQLTSEKIELFDGQQIVIYGDDLEADAIVRWSKENIWAAELVSDYRPNSFE
jgi:hypothetical protein